MLVGLVLVQITAGEKLSIAGNLTATGYLSAAAGINVPDSSKITLGDDHDLADLSRWF